MKHQTHIVKQHLKHCTTNSSNLIKQIINQLIKGCYLTMHNAVLLTDENTALHTANQKQYQKHSKSVSFILQRGILIIQERQLHMQLIQNNEKRVGEQSINELKC